MYKRNDVTFNLSDEHNFACGKFLLFTYKVRKYTHVNKILAFYRYLIS